MSNVPAAGADGDNDDPAVGEDGVAPEDGDSADQPERPGDPGFLLGSVSAPVGDRSDWSAFEVSLGDPTTAFVSLFCTSFSGSGTLVVTVSTEADPIGQLRCTQTRQQDETTLSLRVGSTYLVAAEFQGSGYADWFIQAGDDD